jgi:ketohexokinase
MADFAGEISMSEATAPRIRLVGNVLVDQVMKLPYWPGADEELRALGFDRRVGGNAANSALRLAAAGHVVELVCALSADAEAAWLRQSLEDAGVDMRRAEIQRRGRTPLSSVWLVESRATRCIVHYRDLPELSPGHLRRLDATGCDWLHLEGRNVTGLEALLSQPGIDRSRCSLELEKPREGLEPLLDRVGWVIVSSAYLQQTGETATEALARLQRTFPHLRLVCTQGARGLWMAGPRMAPRPLPAAAVAGRGDSLGAGDVFIAGLIAALAQDRGFAEAVDQGQRWAAERIAGERR